jgi:hypothetical protein
MGAQREELTEAIDSHAASVERLATLGSDSISQELLQFWQAGLRIAERGSPPACPMCEGPTLTVEKRESLADRISIRRECSSAREEAAEAVRRVRDLIAGLIAQVEAMLPEMPEDAAPVDSAELSAEARAAIASYLRTLTWLRGEWASTHATAAGHLRGLARLGAALDDPEEALRLVEGLLLERLEALPEAFHGMAGGIEGLVALFRDMEARLEGELLSTSEARRIEALIAGLETRPHLAVMSAFNAVREEAAAESRALEKALQAEQRAVFSHLEDSVRGYYDLIYPASSVRFSAIEPATGAVRLLAECMGEEMSAAACLSTSQLNSLGLALHLVRAADPASPFGFVVLDDPFQGMDDERCQNLIAGVLPRLLDGARKQVVVLTHRRDLAERIRAPQACRNPLLYLVETSEKWATVQRVEG